MSMDGRYCAKSHGRRCAYVQDVRTDICSCNICTSAIRGGRIAQRATEGGALMYRMDGQIFAPRQLLDLVSTITAPALFYLQASCPNEPFYHLHPCKCPALS